MSARRQDAAPFQRPAAKVGLAAGPALCALFIVSFDLEPGAPQVTRTAAVALLMALWWITEAVPLSITSLVPIVLFPLLGIMNGQDVASRYFNDIIFLFLGGFLVATAMERWNLHKRIALTALVRFGGGANRFLLGVMAITAFLSMWISNTAAAMMMVTILVAVLLQLETTLAGPVFRRLATGLLLGVAYSASIGGLATLVGTPPNMSFSRIFAIQFPDAPEITFTRWFVFAAPVSLLLLAITWLLLCWQYAPRRGQWQLDRGLLERQRDQLGKVSFAEAIVLADFAALVFLWIFRAETPLGAVTIPGWSSIFSHPRYIGDGTVAMGLALVLFLIPSRDGAAGRILDGSAVAKLPWGIVVLLGGGFALASGFEQSGLSAWLGGRLTQASSVPPYALVLLLCLATTFLTELTSNTATTNMLLPLLAALAKATDIHPLLILIPVTLSCSCAFMMPVATPPNAIVFGTGRLRVADMVRSGLALNLIGVLVIVLAIAVLGPLIWHIDLNQVPDWAR